MSVDDYLDVLAGLAGAQQQASPDSTSPSATEGTDSCAGSATLLHDSQDLRTDQELEDDLETEHDDELSRGLTPGSSHKKRKRRVLFSKVCRQTFSGDEKVSAVTVVRAHSCSLKINV